ncbi:hypothetical protein B0T22DRAFT_513801 [Podospora appendiculata]|uniref:Uncharacterized protein n=1 Tax=Podospora appendiculata TaxID=314037 RepID=A0AAE1CDG4_9PEZI|nr:hypothetical protein B0T22DRAFT_513801 [Podospora appendiculata]
MPDNHGDDMNMDFTGEFGLNPADRQPSTTHSMTHGNIIESGINLHTLDITMADITQSTASFSGAGYNMPVAPTGPLLPPGFAFLGDNHAPVSPQYTPAHTPLQGMDYGGNLGRFSPQEAHQPSNQFDPTAGRSGRVYREFSLQPSLGDLGSPHHAPYMPDPNEPSSFQEDGPSAVLSSPGSVHSKLDSGPAWSKEEEQSLLQLKRENYSHKDIRKIHRRQFGVDRNENVISKKHKKLLERLIKALGLDRFRDMLVPLMTEAVVDEFQKFTAQLPLQQNEAVLATYQEVLHELHRVTAQFGDEVVATLAKVVPPPKNTRV